ncbi:MAG: SPOR domain-containing protein [Alphaproteobacteria bacterium]|nr:SPOR domain-containing protein [Alphaproteobacteria bacterium]
MNETSIEQATQQNNVHPMAAAPAQVQTLPIQNVRTPANKTSNVTTITMSKLSLFSISLSLMFLGSLTFFSGFLLGMWFSTPAPGIHVSPLRNQEQTSGYIASPPKQQSPSSVGDSSLGAQLQDIASQEAGREVQSMILEAKPTNLPSFLTPLVSATAQAMGQQADQKTQQEASYLVNQAASTVHRVVTAPTPNTSSTTVPPASSLSTITPYTNTPVTAPQPSPSSSPQPSAASPSPSSPSTSSENYTVQLGVYASKENASNLVSHLQGLNINSQITQSKAPDGDSMYYVHSGFYGDYNMAKEAATQFADKIPGALVVKISENNAGHS